MATTKRVTITDETIREIYRLTPDGEIKRNVEAFKKLVFPYWGKGYYGASKWISRPVSGKWAGIGKCKIETVIIRKVLEGTAKPFSFETHVFLSAEAARVWGLSNKHEDHKIVQTKATKEAAAKREWVRTLTLGERSERVEEVVRDLLGRLEAGEIITKTEAVGCLRDCY